jgi:hypothetical protein
MFSTRSDSEFPDEKLSWYRVPTIWEMVVSAMIPKIQRRRTLRRRS